MEAYCCKINPRCIHETLPGNLDVLCVCAKQAMDPAWTPSYIRDLEAYKRVCEQDEQGDDANRIIGMIRKLNEREAAA